MKSGGEARRVSFVSLVFFMCFAALGLIGGGIGFIFVHPDLVGVASTMISIGVSLFPVAYIFKGAASKDSGTTSSSTPVTISTPSNTTPDVVTIDVDSTK
jgi:hypothetical protein